MGLRLSYKHSPQFAGSQLGDALKLHSLGVRVVLVQGLGVCWPVLLGPPLTFPFTSRGSLNSEKHIACFYVVNLRMMTALFWMFNMASRPQQAARICATNPEAIHVSTGAYTELYLHKF